MAYSATECKGDGMGDYGRPCNGYARTESPCAVCVVAHKLYSTEENSAGFVEAETEDFFPVDIYVTINTGEVVKVERVRESSIKAEMRSGVSTLSFEFWDNKNRIGYVPFLMFYATEFTTN